MRGRRDGEDHRPLRWGGLTAHGVSDGELRRRYAQVFDDVAEEYDRERQGYPDELIDAAFRVAGLNAGDRVLEVGSGTGLLTAPLLARGLSVDAVDPGANMIRSPSGGSGRGRPCGFIAGGSRRSSCRRPRSPRYSRRPRSTGSTPRSAGRGPPACSGPTACSRCSSTRGRGRDHGRGLASAPGRTAQVAPEIAAGGRELRDADTILNGAAERAGQHLRGVVDGSAGTNSTVPEAARCSRRAGRRPCPWTPR